MTMNLPPQYNQSPQYLEQPLQGYNSTQMRINVNDTHLNQHSGNNIQREIHQSSNENAYIPSIPLKYSKGYITINTQQNLGQRYFSGVPGHPSRQIQGGKYINGGVNLSQHQVRQRQNNFTRSQSQKYYCLPHPNNYESPMHSPIHNFNKYPQKQPQGMYQQPKNYYQSQFHNQPQQQPQNYLPSYTSTMMNNYHGINNLKNTQMRQNVPQQSINSNFSYNNANFDCNYSVQENLVHCVLCNQTYKINQKKQHLQLHRQKIKNIDTRPVDAEQLKRLHKYNQMTQKGLIIKPIVQPDEFNVQYNPNQFVLKKTTQYKDIYHPYRNNIQIQTQDPNAVTVTHNLASNFLPQNRQRNAQMDRNSQKRQRNAQMARNSQHSQRSQMTRNSKNKQRNGQISRNSESSQKAAPQRNTKTRFNYESIRQEQQIFLSDGFQNNQAGSAFKPNLDLNDQSVQEQIQRRQKSQSLSPRFTNTKSEYRNTNLNNQSSIAANNLRYQKKDTPHNISQNDSHENAIKQIPIEKIVEEVIQNSRHDN